MLLRTSLRQAVRSPIRMVICFSLMVLICALLTIGLNLRVSSEQNLAAIYDSYEVIAVPDFQTYMTRGGEPIAMGNHAGYWPCAAEDYDITPLSSATGVESIDIRNRFGAYVKNENFQRGFTLVPQYLTFTDVIRFIYNGETAVTLPESSAVSVEVIWSAAGYPDSTYPSTDSTYPSKIHFDNNTTAKITLEPGKEYIASVVSAGSFQFGQYMNQVKSDGLALDACEYYRDARAYYDSGAHWEYYRGCPYEPIALYTEDFWDTEQGQYFINAAKGSYYNLRSINAVTTGDLMSVLPFYNGYLSIVDGRAFSEQDYTDGTKVCIVSRYLAGLNGWEIGDRIDLSFFESQYLFSKMNADYIPRYAEPVSDFFDEGSYEIIGFYDGRVTTGLKSYASTQYDETQGALWIDIYLPERSVENAPAPKISEYNTTIRIEPLSGQKFLAEMSDSSLMEKKSEGYQLGLTLYDQGLSAMADGLAQLSSISTLTISLAAAAAALSVMVLATFHVWRSKKEIACLRSLGVRRRQVLIIMLAAFLLVCFLGCITGAVMGHGVSYWVAGQILASANEDVGDTSFTANTAKDQLFSLREDYQFQQVRQVEAAVCSAAAVFISIVLFGSVLIWNESRKPPLRQLGRKE